MTPKARIELGNAAIATNAMPRLRRLSCPQLDRNGATCRCPRTGVRLPPVLCVVGGLADHGNRNPLS